MRNSNVKSIVTALLSTTLVSVVLAQSYWTRQSPIPSDRTPKGVFAISPERAFFVGSDEMILETTTAGSTWNLKNVGNWQGDPHYTVYFPSSQVGIITGNNGALRSVDGGASWTPVAGFPAGSWSYLDFITPSIGFAGANGACAATTDGGLTWSVRSGYPTCPVMFGMDFIDANVGIVGGLMAGAGDSGIYKTTDGGRTWTKRADGAANDVLWMSSTRALADSGTTMRESLDRGDSWHTIATGIESGLLSMARAGNSSVVLGVSGKGDVWRSADGGYTWTQTFDGPGALPEEWDISFADDLHGWIVGPGGFYYYTNNGGVNWIQKNTGCSAQVEDIHILNANYGLAVGHDGYVFRTTNGGAFWEIQKLEVTGQIWGRDEGLVAVDVVDEDFAVAAGPGGTVFKTTNGGVNWTSIGYPNLSGRYWIYDVDFIDHNLGYVYGVNPDVDHMFLFRTRDGGASWEWVNMGTNLGGGFTLQFIDAQNGWLTADNNFGWRTSDGGVSWTSFLMPLYFSGPEVSKVRFLNLNEGWAVGWEGYVAKTSNGGFSWTLIDIGTIDDHLFDVVPISNSEIWLCGREATSFAGVVYRSTNGGSTWTRQVVTDWFYYPYRMAVLPSGDAWFGGYAGSIFRRTAQPVIVSPGSFQLQAGTLMGGTLASLLQSDDQYLVAGPQVKLTRNNVPIMLQVDGAAPTANPSSMEFLFESRVSTFGIQLKIELWNFAQSRWEVVHTSPATQSDNALTISAPAPIARFIDPQSRGVRSRIGWTSQVNLGRKWRAYVDRANWRFTP